MKKLLLILLLLPTFAHAQSNNGVKPYELYIYFCADFKDTFKVYFNEALISRGAFITDKSTAVVNKYLTAKVTKGKNILTVKSIKNKLLWEVKIPYVPSLNHLYLRRYSGVWNHELSDKLIEAE